MCGIIGAVLSDDRDLRSFDRCVDALAHRGPDGRGALRAGRVLLGHRRLSIIDLSDAAAQPMQHPESGAIVFNGEIYDYATHRAALADEGVAFAAHSDTEVLLHGLARRGPDFLRGLHGMYAFAWLSSSGDRLVLARDHAGMKPLYVAEGRFGFAFASEVRALGELLRALDVPVRLNADAVARFLAWGAVPEPDTILAGIRMLPADSFLEIDVRQPRRTRAGRTERIAARHAPSERAVVESIRASTRRHLIADRPVAVFLSAGLDSSVLACEASDSASKPHAITVSLDSAGTSDEVAVAAELCRTLGIEHHVVGAGDWSARLDDALSAYDQPSIDGLNTFVVSRVARELGYVVALSGVGADEVLGGYSHFRARWLRPAHELGVRGAVLEPLVAEIASRAAGPLRRAAIVVASASSGEPAHRSVRRLMPEREIAMLTRAATTTIDRTPGDPLLAEQHGYLRDTLLRDTDVMGMANGVEIRAPYLDPEVMVSAASLGTPELLRRDRAPKFILRDGWARRLPARAKSRRKTGFTLDLPSWLRGAGAGRVDAAVDVLRRSSIVDRSALDLLVSRSRRGLLRGSARTWPLLFALVQLAEQLRRWGEP